MSVPSVPRARPSRRYVKIKGIPARRPQNGGRTRRELDPGNIVFLDHRGCRQRVRPRCFAVGENENGRQDVTKTELCRDTFGHNFQGSAWSLPNVCLIWHSLRRHNAADLRVLVKLLLTPRLLFVFSIDRSADASAPVNARIASMVSGMTIAWLSTRYA